MVVESLTAALVGSEETGVALTTSMTESELSGLLATCLQAITAPSANDARTRARSTSRFRANMSGFLLGLDFLQNPRRDKDEQLGILPVDGLALEEPAQPRNSTQPGHAGLCD